MGGRSQKWIEKKMKKNSLVQKFKFNFGGKNQY